MRTKLISFLILVSVLIVSFSLGQENPQWKGKVEYEDGIKVIKNSKESIYGEITFELEEVLSIGKENENNFQFYRVLDIEVDRENNIFVLDSGNHRVQKYDKRGKYLFTIGKRGQGPGEFNQPMRLKLDLETGNIYVNDNLRKVIVFNQDGEHIDKDINFGEGLKDFYIDYEKNIIGKFFGPGYSAIVKIEMPETNQKRIVEFPFKNTLIDLGEKTIGNRKASRWLYITTGWEYGLGLSQIDNKTFVYGYSKEYELTIVSSEGEILYKIIKNEPYKRFTSADKERIEYDLKMSALRQGKTIPDISLNLPEYMPFFSSIFTDSYGRIYVKRKSLPGVYDIFSKEGYYLYQASVSTSPEVIKDGFLFAIILDEDSGSELIKKFKITNWNQIIEGISN